jgi:arylsulfate sulfotransferase
MFQAGTREDVAVVIDRATGAVKKTYDFREIIDETRAPYHHFHPDILNAPNNDWMHANLAVYDEMRNAVIVSSPMQSLVISIDADTSGINWMLGPHEGYREEFMPYLLAPIGEGFEWQWCQHSPVLLENDDPAIFDILLFDNGQNKSFHKETAVLAADNYSRAVIYRINAQDMKAEQIWQYGKERGAENYAAFLGSVQMLDGGNVLIAFGGQLRLDGVPVDDIVDGVVGDLVTNSRIIEVTSDGEVIYEVSARENAYTNSAETYQAKRVPLFMPDSYQVALGEAKGRRLGANYFSDPPEDKLPVPQFYFGKFSADFSVLHRENDRLVIEGILSNNGVAHLLSKTFLVLQGKRDSYVFEANSGLNGRFFLSIDLSGISAGEYRLAIIGATVDGNDALGKRSYGYLGTEWKVGVE